MCTSLQGGRSTVQGTRYWFIFSRVLLKGTSARKQHLGAGADCYSYWDAHLAARFSSALQRLCFLYRRVTLSHHMFAVEVHIVAVPVLQIVFIKYHIL